MFKKNPDSVGRLIEDLSQMELMKRTDKEARELFLDQIAVSISSGGRGLLLAYTMSIIFLPFAFRTLPRVVIRAPLAVGLGVYYEEIYFLGARLKLKRTQWKIIKQMKSLEEGSKLKEYANKWTH